ncbi:MAG TPA: DUF3426 domain-containing protein [Rhodanobacteraceae bacterium]|nr:DUF3426 domain-containing protein [Rhodanobacteraceae bacterium]
MYTQCPNCLTIYEIDEDALQASLGIVRCGRCDQRFDALQTLSDTLQLGDGAMMPRHESEERAPTLTEAVLPAAIEAATKRSHGTLVPAAAGPDTPSNEDTDPAHTGDPLFAPASGERANALIADAAGIPADAMESESAWQVIDVPPPTRFVEPDLNPMGAWTAGVHEATAASPVPSVPTADSEPFSGSWGVDIPNAGPTELPDADVPTPPDATVQSEEPGHAAAPTIERGFASSPPDAAAIEPADQEPFAEEAAADMANAADAGAPATGAEPADADMDVALTDKSVARSATPASFNIASRAVRLLLPLSRSRERARGEGKGWRASSSGIPQSTSGDVDANTPVYVPPHRRHIRPSDWLWGLGCLILALVLAAQLVWAKRGTLIRNPSTQAWAVRVCARLDCRLPLIRDVAKLELLSRDVRPDPRVAGALMITATLRNDAVFRQPWPVVVVELTDLDNDVVAMRRFRPAEYMPDPVRRDAGIAPDATAAVAFEVADPGKRAVAFRFSFE